MSTSSKETIWAVFLFCAGFLLYAHVIHPLQRKHIPTTELIIAAEIDRGNIFEIYVNNDVENPIKQQIKRGLVEYHFGPITPPITQLRIDFTDAPNSTVRLSAVKLVQNEKVLEEVKGDQFLFSGMNGFVRAGDAAAGELKLQSVSSDPIVLAHDLNWGPASEPVFVRLVRVLPVLLLALLFAPLLFQYPSAALTAAIAAPPVMLYLGPSIYKSFDAAGFSLQPVRASVGQSVYLGESKAADQAGFLTFVGLSALFGLLTLFTKARAAEFRFEALKKTSSAAKLLFYLAAALLVLLLYEYPPIGRIVSALPETKHDIGNFDVKNLLLWQYFAEAGLLPFRDYWFCYGGAYDQLSPFPHSVLKNFFHSLILFVFTLAAVYELCGRSVRRTLLVLVPVGFLIESGYIAGSARYFLALTGILALAALDLGSLKHFVLLWATGLFFGFAFSYEPNQLIYAAPGLALIFGFALVSAVRSGQFGCFVRDFLILAGSAGAVVAAYLVSLYLNGQLPYFIQFYRDMAALGVSVSIGSEPAYWIRFSTDQKALVSLGLSALAAASLALLILQKKMPALRSVALAVAGICLMEIMVFQKMLLRPHVEAQVIGPIIVAVLLFLQALSSFWSPRALRVFFLGAGLSVSMLSAPSFSALPYFFQRSFGPERVVETAKDIALTVSKGIELPEDAFDNYFSPASFIGWDEDQKSVQEFLAARVEPGEAKLFVLGYDTYFYLTLKQKAPRFLSLYEASPISDQREMERWLEQTRPAYVIWNYIDKSFDGVPDIVRSPVIMNYVIRHYSPVFRSGRFVVLSPRGEKPFDWQFWSDAVGADIPLGAIPGNSTAETLPACRNGKCIDFLRVKAPTCLGGPLAIQIALPARSFNLSFLCKEGGKEGADYMVNLSRLWFWQMAKREGITPAVNAGPGIIATAIEQKQFRPDFLY